MEALSATTPSDADATTVGSYSLTIRWASTTAGVVECSREVWSPGLGTAVRKVGDLDFSIEKLGDLDSWDLLHEAKSTLNSSKLCLWLTHIGSEARNIPGIGAACIYALARLAEQRSIDHIIVWSAVPDAIGFYVKMGFAMYSLKCADMYGETGTVRQKSLTSASSK